MQIRESIHIGLWVAVMTLLPITLLQAEEIHPLLSIERDVEDWYMSRLAQVQANPKNKLMPFTTDGCSGGLSEGWSTMSKLIPAFKRKFGEAPPYEFCCVVHDRDYWRGDTEQGYAKRLLSDETLRACVIDYGKQHRSEFAKEFSLSEDTIDKNFAITANLMFHVIRLGGKPCSYLPWRWGYGWADCPILTTPTAVESNSNEAKVP